MQSMGSPSSRVNFGMSFPLELAVTAFVVYYYWPLSILDLLPHLRRYYYFWSMLDVIHSPGAAVAAGRWG